MSKGRRAGTAAGAGFTLLELAIVMVLMGMALAVSIPALQRGAAALALRAAGRDVLNCLRYAREKAITEGTGPRVVFTPENQSVTLTRPYGGGARRVEARRDVRSAA